MAVNRIQCEASPEQIFALLSDPRLYAYFVVGTRTIRRFDPRWPDPGSEIHHSLGFGITVLRDATLSVEADPPRELVLRVRMRPLGITRTVFRLTPQPEGTLVELEETPIEGPLATDLAEPIVDRLMWLRNYEVLRRLRKLVLRRQQQQAE